MPGKLGHLVRGPLVTIQEGVNCDDIVQQESGLLDDRLSSGKSFADVLYGVQEILEVGPLEESVFPPVASMIRA